MRARMYIEIDTEYGTITNTALCYLDGKIDDVHKLQYAGSVMFDRIMRYVNEEFKRRNKNGLYTYKINNVGETLEIPPQGPQEYFRV